MDWWKAHHGAPTDPKWILVARKAGCIPAVVSAIAWALFDHASQAESRGSVTGFDCEVYAAWGGLDEDVVRQVIAAMEEKSLIVDGTLSAWERRQEPSADSSTARTRAYRERKRQEVEGGNPPAPLGPPEEPPKAAAPPRHNDEERTAERAAFARFWAAYPNKVGKPAAELKFRKVWKAADEIIAGLQRYITDKPADRSWLNPTTFLSQERWKDSPAPAGSAAVPPGARKYADANQIRTFD